jgi:hypothetical protein
MQNLKPFVSAVLFGSWLLQFILIDGFFLTKKLLYWKLKFGVSIRLSRLVLYLSDMKNNEFYGLEYWLF